MTDTTGNWVATFAVYLTRKVCLKATPETVIREVHQAVPLAQLSGPANAVDLEKSLLQEDGKVWEKQAQAESPRQPIS